MAIFAATAFAGGAAGGASAATFLLKDTGAGNTNILNTTDELTGGDSAVAASAKGVAFTDVGYFSVEAGELLTGFSVISQGSSKIAEISGGEAELYQQTNGVWSLLPATVTPLATATAGVVSPLATFSGQLDLGAGIYKIVVDSFGVDTVRSQGKAKFAVALEGISVPEPATWAMMMLGVGLIGLAARRRNAGVALAA